MSSTRPLRSGRRWAAQVLTSAVLLGLVAVLTVAVLVPKMADARTYSVLTSSMSPALPVGTLVVVRPVVPEAVNVGSVITYQLRPGRPETVTHRVVGRTVDADGIPVFSTQGDANATADPDGVRPVQVRGEVWYSVPYVGYLSSVLDPAVRRLLRLLAALLLFGYAAALLGGSIREVLGQPRRRAVLAREGPAHG